MNRLDTTYLQRIQLPDPNSHKGQNGILYIAAGSRQYHGSLWYAIEAASHFVDLIYIDTDKSNLLLLKKLKSLHPAIIVVPPRQRKKYLQKSDCVLMGPGLGRSPATQRFVARLLKDSARPSKVVIDADALNYINPSQLDENTVLTPHGGEYQRLFGTKKPEILTKSIACVVVKKGPTTAICQNGECSYNTHGSAGLTKGGTGDVLASLIAALSCTNPVMVSSCAASFLIGKSAEQLSARSGTYFSTVDLIKQLPVTLHQCRKLRKKKN